MAETTVEKSDIKNTLDRIKGRRVIIIGDICLDEYIFGEVRSITKEAPVPALYETRRSLYAGQVGNVAVNASAVGGEVHLFTAMGNDSSGDELRKIFDGYKVNLYNIKTDFTTHRTKLIHFNNQQGYNHLYHIYKESVVQYDTSEKLWDNLLNFISDGDVVVISDYQLGVFNRDYFIKVNESCSTVVNSRRELREFEGANVVICNESEVLISFPESEDADIDSFAGRLREELHLGDLLVTRGSRGMTLYGEGGEYLNLPPIVVNALDVTGAGDGVVAGYSLGMTSGLSRKRSFELANMIAGVIVGKEGTGVCCVDDIVGLLDV